MKYTALASHNNYTSTHGREYSSKSPKPASTYSEGFNFSYNTPKATPAKGFVLPKSNNENLTVLTQSMKFESTLNNKPKTTKSTAITLASATPSQKNLGGYSYNASQASGMRNSAVKPRADILKTMASSTPKSTVPYKSAEPLKSREDSVNANTQYRWKKLEISTEFNNRNSYGSSATKAQTTKNTEVDDHLQRGNNGYTVPTQPSVGQRAARDERSADLKPKGERPLSSNPNNKSSTNINKGMSSSGVFQKNPPSTPVKETTLKKPSSAMLKTTGSDERMTQSTAFSAKKGGLSSQADMRASWQGSSESNKKAAQRPLSAKKPAKEEAQLTRPSTATKEDKTAAQKTSLNSFVTKVNQGDLFGAKNAQANTPSTANSGSITATSLLAKKRESSAKRTQKPMLTLDDKVTKADTKGPKTTPNVEIRNFTINLGKGNNTPSSAAQKNAAASSKTKYGTSTPKEKGSIEIPGSRKNGSQPFVYYMTGLEKAHRHAGEVDYFTQIYREHFVQSYQALSFCKMLRPTDPAVIAQKKAHLPRREAHRDRKTLVFDMDETLIHCNESADMPADVILPITFPNGEVVEAGVNIRPYAIECLKELSQHFEIIVFTASHACYANVVLDYLDPHQQYIHHRLFRDSCVVTDEGVHIKDLRVIGNRALSDMLLIDNAAYSFGFQIENGVPIIPFYDNKNDQELLHLIPYLKFLGSTKDMRDLNKQTFKFDIYHAHDTPDVVLDRLF